MSIREKSIEHPNGIGDRRLNTPQSRDNSHIRPIVTKLPERYERGEFHPHIHFAVRSRDRSLGSLPCCGVFVNANHLNKIHLGMLLGLGADDGQFPMLVKAIHVVKDEQGVMRTLPLGDSVVWLQRLNDRAGLVTDSLYFSVEQGKFVGSRRLGC